MESREDWQRLGLAVAARRRWLGLTQQAIAGRGGPSSATQRSIEKALAQSYQPGTLTNIDDGLGWLPGTARAVLRESAPAGVTVPFEDWVQREITGPDRYQYRAHDAKLAGQSVAPSVEAVPYVADAEPGVPLTEVDDEALEHKIKEGLEAMAEMRRRHGG